MTSTTTLQSLQRLPLSALRESSTNPRKLFKGIDELAETIRKHGVIQPLIVRPLLKPEKGITHEIAAGARRFRASKVAGVPDAPVDIRDLTDDQMDDFQQIENLQREDLGPVEEAEGFARLIAKPGQSIQTIAARLGKRPEYVASRLALMTLTDAPRQALAEERIGLPHAMKIATLPDTLQAAALDACFMRSWNSDTGLLPVTQLEHWIERNVLMTLKNVCFDTSDASLVSGAGSCEKCPKRTGANTLLFPAIADDSCMDRECMKSKIAAHIEGLQEERPELIRISTASYSNSKDGTLGTESFVIVEPKRNAKKPENRKCEQMKDALVVHGYDAGTIRVVCSDPTCPVHHTKTSERRQREDDYRQTRREEERQKKIQMATRRAIGDAILKKFKAPTVADWQLIATSAVRHLPHELRIDLAKRHGCYPKTKQPGSMEIQGALEKHITSFDMPAVYRFLFDIAILPTIRSRYRSSADSELAALAKRFHVDPKAITQQVRANTKKPKAPAKRTKKGAA